MEDDEEWREVVGYNGFYEVSSLGRIRSWHSGNRHSGADQRAAEPRILNPHRQAAGGGYVAVSMRQGGRQVTTYLHRLVAIAFHGAVPEGMETCHNDGNPANNAPSNLRYDTHANNLAERIMPCGEQHHRSRLTDSDALEVRRLRDECGWKLREIAEKFDIGVTTVHAVTSRRTWVHV